MIVWPAAVAVAGDAVLVSVSFEVWVTATVAVEATDVTVLPFGSLPDTTAEFLIDPASMSACLVV